MGQPAVRNRDSNRRWMLFASLLLAAGAALWTLYDTVISSGRSASMTSGAHTFDVRATDGAGNTPAPPARPASGACMPSPAACGYPDVSTTGVQPGVTLSPASGTVHLATPGMVYENRLVTGDIIVEAPNVTIRNVKLVKQNPSYGISVKNGGSWQDTQAGLLLDHVEIDLGGTMDGNGIAFNGYTARHVFFHNGADCAAMGQNVLIEDSLCVDGPDANGDGWPDSTGFCNGPEHIDGFQSDGGSGITLRHNTMRNPCEQTSNILLSSNTGHISNARVEDNLLAGGGYSLYCAGMADRSSVTNIVATGNRIARTYFPRGGKWGPTAYCEYADTFSGNVWDDTGKPLQ
jgi:hypothetical protein